MLLMRSEMTSHARCASSVALLDEIAQQGSWKEPQSPHFASLRPQGAYVRRNVLRRPSSACCSPPAEHHKRHSW